MAFPQVAAVNGGYTLQGTSHTVKLPAGINAGDLLLVLFAADGNPTITFPEGWTQLFQWANDTWVVFGCWYRVADGGEGATINVTTGDSEKTNSTSYRITGYSGTPEAGGIITVGNSGNPDPPDLIPTWGARDTLWLAVCGYDYQMSVTAYPTNYTDGLNNRGSYSGSCGVGSARRELNAASENPGTFTVQYSDQWVANTVAIQPWPPAAVGRSFGYIFG